MTNKNIIFVVGAVFLVITLPLLADSYTPSHSCSKPYKPYKFNSQWQLDSFNNDVDTYKRCISNFVDEQNEEAEKHKQAATDAIDEWNRFVNYEL